MPLLLRLDMAAPFKAEPLTVHITRDVSTRFRHRGSSLEPIARLIAPRYQEAPGSYIAFFSSFDYLERAVTDFSALYPFNLAATPAHGRSRAQ